MYQVNFLPRRQRRDRRRAYFWLGVLLLQVMALLLALFTVAGQLRHQQTQRQARLAMLGEELTALTSLARQQQQERAQQAMHSARAERQANNAQHNRRYLQLLQQLSSSIPPPLWLTALDSNAANGLRLRGLSRSPAAITQFERRLAGMPALPRLHLAEVAQREDGLYSFHLAVQWGVMDSRLSSGLRLWLSLPGWLLLLSQGLGIGTLALLGGGWLLQDEWRQRANAAERQQRLLQQIAMVQSQLEETPQTVIPAAARADHHRRFGERAATGGGALLRWQRQEKPPRQTLSLRIDYTGLLVLLEALPADLRLEQLSVETPPLGMTARLVLQDATEDQPDE